jgi:ubiquinone/menaquinone biosynthesis C-methylase UbiE
MQQAQNKVQKLYQRRGVFYHKLFIDFFGLENRFEKFFTESNYLASNIKILDAGCGSGTLLRAIYKAAHKKDLNNIIYHGFDFSETMLDQFKFLNKKQHITDIALFKADVLHPEQLPETWNSYDMIVSNGMLEYIPKLEFDRAIKNLKLLLNDDGILIIFMAKKNILTKFLIELWWKARTFKKNEIRLAMQNAGFTQININNFSLNIFCIEAKK